MNVSVNKNNRNNCEEKKSKRPLNLLILAIVTLALSSVGLAQTGNTVAPPTTNTAKGAVRDIGPVPSEGLQQPDFHPDGTFSWAWLVNGWGHFVVNIQDSRIRSTAAVQVSMCEYWTDYHYCGWGSATQFVIENIVPYNGGVNVWVNTNWTNNSMNLRLSYSVSPNNY
jgi:hypothetical protein